MKNHLILFSVVLWAGLLIFLHPVMAGVNIYEKPRELPQSKIINQNGDKFRLLDFKGDFVLAHFWSRNCAPCIKELKSLNRFHNKVKNDGIRLIIIAPNDEWFDANEQRKFLKRYGAQDLEFYTEEDGKLSADFGIFTTPHTVVISSQGLEIGRLRGSETWDKTKVIDYIKSLKDKSK